MYDNKPCVSICFSEREDKYKNVVHQNDMWHGGKSIKKVNAVCTNKNM